MLYLCNVFTTAMLDVSQEHTYHFTPIAPETVHDMLVSIPSLDAVGHPATCEVLSARLGLEIKPNRANVRLGAEDSLIVAQVVIPRLAEGQVLTREQVEACPMQFWLVDPR